VSRVLPISLSSSRSVILPGYIIPNIFPVIKSGSDGATPRDVKSSDWPLPRGQKKNWPWPRWQRPRSRPRDTAASASCCLALWSRLLQCIYFMFCCNCYCKVSYHENQGWQRRKRVQKWTRPRKKWETVSGHTGVNTHGISYCSVCHQVAHLLLIHFGLGLGLSLGHMYFWPC